MSTSVLIVDDHASFRKFARRVLEDAGFTVVGEAADCAAALDAAERLRPDVVLLDVLLPDGSGLDVAGALDRGGDAPAVVLTSSRSASDLGEALRTTPSSGFIPKDELSGRSFAQLVRSS
jgi:DNA-binding NarL/FixJ family response regulator